MLERKITKQQERAFRLCHHDFEGLTVKEAAKIMDITASAVYGLLAEVKRIAPQLFPILTPQQNAVKRLIVDMGQSYSECADELHYKMSAVVKTMEQLARMGIKPTKTKVISYSSFMDNQIKEIF